jgi:uncharacterized protein YjbI with pentapeptide repeats
VFGQKPAKAYLEFGRRDLPISAPPDEYADLFLSPDPKKDPDAFWAALQEVYLAKDGSWDADWSGFVFPDQVGQPFSLATFREPADFSGVTFLGRAVFGGIFEAPVSFAKAKFRRGAHFYLGSTFHRYADFSGAVFLGDGIFSGVQFKGATDFSRAIFCDGATFYRANFGKGSRERLRGAVLMAAPPLPFSLSISEAIFQRDVTFAGARVEGELFAKRTAFRGSASFTGARIQHMVFLQTRVEGELALGVDLGDSGSLLLSEVGSRRTPGDRLPPTGPALVRFGRMSLTRVELGSLSAEQAGGLRFARALDIDKLSFTDVAWPEVQRGYRVGDEEDLATREHVKTGRASSYDSPSVQELERIYRSLRKNFEDRQDRVGAHRWYFAEMDVGRRHNQWNFTRLARWFYWLTSGYGLAPLRPLLALLLVAAMAFGFYMVPAAWACPTAEATGGCAGWQDVSRVILSAVSFQGLPDGLSLPGLLANLVWVTARFAGAAMLLSIGVAFRNQIAR